ncbi:MAG: Holliday junction branch migration protein RuvA [Candidatus Moraniibacteriota bacterium]|nr:MAG: Holliday junction branch migration protein RuvA [Candidatus Moranbacteria bacterium]
MIGFLKGDVLKKNDDNVIIGVNGVGYKVFMTEYGIEQCGNASVAISVYTHVREQEISLYGFLQEEEQEIFELLISVSGIGPKAALNILTVSDVVSIKAAIVAEDTTILTKVSGIGPKTAKKVVHELSDKIVVPINKAVGGAVANSDAIDALRSMGYSVTEARDALSEVSKDIVDVGERVKEALKYLGK